MKWDLTDKGKEWHKNYDARNIRFEATFRKESGIMEALDKACVVQRRFPAARRIKNNHSLFSCEALNTVIK